MFGPVFSEEGANQRQKEEDLMEMWTEYLGLVDQDMTKITASEILRFTSGVDEVPLIGWGDGKQPMLLFDREPISPLPTSSTCEPTLILPLWSYKNLTDFCDIMETSVLYSPSILRD
ncbi:hypothetical protein SNE40_016911 [Patella caerulea]|uniref:HECT domain-containing protein n=1 Tax=Patella caerulea TaxID=87958 RepID=A0AAN8JFC4_PATCE